MGSAKRVTTDERQIIRALWPSYGVSDIAVLPRNGSGPSVVIELKEVPAGGDLEETVMYAMRQIESKRYTLGVKGDPVRACGIAIGSDGVAVRIS